MELIKNLLENESLGRKDTFYNKDEDTIRLYVNVINPNSLLTLMAFCELWGLTFIIMNNINYLESKKDLKILINKRP